MKKEKLIDLFKTLILPTITVGIVSFFFTYICFDDRRRLFSNPKFLHIAILVSVIGAVVCGLFIWLSIFMHRRHQRCYDQMNIWLDGIKRTEDIFELEAYIETLRNFKYSKNCPSAEHVQYANEIILFTKTKLDIIKKARL